MIKLNVIMRDGSSQSVSAERGVTLMEAIRDAGIYELVAMCGGCCSCATCHIFVETGPEGLIGPASDDEDALLDSSDARQGNSRLSCQMELTADLDGIEVRIAPED